MLRCPLFGYISCISLQRVGTSTENVLLQSTSFGHADAPRRNIAISKTQGLVDSNAHGTNNPGPSNHL